MVSKEKKDASRKKNNEKEVNREDPLSPLIVYYQPPIKIEPTLASKGSKYVDYIDGHAVVQKKGLVSQTSKTRKDSEAINFIQYHPERVFNRDSYFGMTYPDGTSHTFIPISGVTISFSDHYNRDLIDLPGRGTKEFHHVRDNIVSVSIPKSLLNQILLHARSQALSLISPNDKNYLSGYDFFDCAAVHRNIVWTMVENKYYQKNVFAALNSCGFAKGMGYFVLKHRSTLPLDQSVYLEFHSLMLQENIDGIFGPFAWDRVHL